MSRAHFLGPNHQSRLNQLETLGRSIGDLRAAWKYPGSDFRPAVVAPHGRDRRSAAALVNMGRRAEWQQALCRCDDARERREKVRILSAVAREVWRRSNPCKS